MANSFNETIATDRDWIRSWLDDRGTTFNENGDPIWLRSNEAIDGFLAIYPDRRMATWVIDHSILNEISKRVDRFTDEDGMSVAWTSRAGILERSLKALRGEIDADGNNDGLMAFGSTRARRYGRRECAEYISRPWRQRDY